MFEIGRSLSEARERRGLALTKIEQDTHIRTRYLNALEEEKFEALPSPAYVRGFLRTYADYLGLDAQTFVDEYNERFAPSEDFAGPQLVKIKPRRRTDVRVLVAVVFAALLGLIGWQLSSSGGGHRAPHALVSKHTRTTRTTTQSTTTITRAVTTAPASARLVLTATAGPCWLMVRRGSSTGPLVYESTLQQGQIVRFTAGTLWVRVGAPWNLNATLAGKRVQLPTVIGNLLVTPRGTTPA